MEIPKFSPKDILKHNKKTYIRIDPQLFTTFSINKKIGKYFKILELKENLIDKVCKITKRKVAHPFYNLDKKI